MHVAVDQEVDEHRVRRSIARDDAALPQVVDEPVDHLLDAQVFGVLAPGALLGLVGEAVRLPRDRVAELVPAVLGDDLVVDRVGGGHQELPAGGRRGGDGHGRGGRGRRGDERRVDRGHRRGGGAARRGRVVVRRGHGAHRRSGRGGRGAAAGDVELAEPLERGRVVVGRARDRLGRRHGGGGHGRGGRGGGHVGEGLHDRVREQVVVLGRRSLRREVDRVGREAPPEEGLPGGDSRTHGGIEVGRLDGGHVGRHVELNFLPEDCRGQDLDTETCKRQGESQPLSVKMNLQRTCKYIKKPLFCQGIKKEVKKTYKDAMMGPAVCLALNPLF